MTRYLLGFDQFHPSATVIDFSEIINSQASISRAKNFEEFALEIIHFIEKISESSRLDIVCDSYLDNSLKAHTRENRGRGQYSPFSAPTAMPIDFQKTFLQHGKNKLNLNLFLAQSLIEHDFGDTVLFVNDMLGATVMQQITRLLI